MVHIYIVLVGINTWEVGKRIYDFNFFFFLIITNDFYWSNEPIYTFIVFLINYNIPVKGA